MTSPPTTGPNAAESWKLPLLHVTATGNSGRGTSCGRIDPLAGQRNARAVPLRSRQTYVHATGACAHETNVSPAQLAAMTISIQRMIARRSRWSAMCPAGSVNSSSGVICANPTNPSARVEFVRS